MARTWSATGSRAVAHVGWTISDSGWGGVTATTLDGSRRHQVSLRVRPGVSPGPDAASGQ